MEQLIRVQHIADVEWRTNLHHPALGHGCEQCFADDAFVLLGSKAVSTLMPLAPATDEAGLEHGDDVGVCPQYRGQLTDVRQDALNRRISVIRLFRRRKVVGEAGHDLRTTVPDDVKATLQVRQQFRRKLRVAPVIQPNVAAHQGDVLSRCEDSVIRQAEIRMEAAFRIGEVGSVSRVAEFSSAHQLWRTSACRWRLTHRWITGRRLHRAGSGEQHDQDCRNNSHKVSVSRNGTASASPSGLRSASEASLTR